jgi:DHA1 family bicyclomycin/chloramphenicol resistance-like MFS transporter
MYGSLLGLAGAAAFLLVVVAGALNVPLTLLTMVVFSFGVAVASPAALAEALSINPLVTGSASGLYGFAQMAIGALCSSLVGIGGSPALTAAVVLCAAGIIGQTLFWMARRARTATVGKTVLRAEPAA